MRRILKLITPFALTVALSGGAYAMGGGSDDGGAAKADPNYAAARQLVEDGKYAEAIPLLEQAVAKDAKNADALNYLGYKIGRASCRERVFSTFRSRWSPYHSKQKKMNIY